MGVFSDLSGGTERIFEGCYDINKDFGPFQRDC